MRIERIDEAVRGSIGGDVLRPEVVMAILDGLIGAIRPPTLARDIDALRKEPSGIEREIARLTNAVAASGELVPLLEALKGRRNLKHLISLPGGDASARRFLRLF